MYLLIIFCMHIACGVAHQALKGIEPKGEDILIQGTALVCLACPISYRKLIFRLYMCIFPFFYLFAGNF